MSEARKVTGAVLIYCAVAASLVVFAIFGLTTVMKGSVELSQKAGSEKTLLDYRTESSHQIRQALAKPILRPEPLPPIAAKLARATTPVETVVSRPDRPKLSKEARNALASANTESSSGSRSYSHSYSSFDRHSASGY
jgi:hypothetical protein